MTEHLVPLSRIAGRLGKSVGVVRAMCRRREIPHYVIGSRYMFSPEEIDHWLELRHRAELARDADAGARDPERHRDHLAECAALGLEEGDCVFS